MRNLQDCFQRKSQLTVNKKRDAGLSDSKVKCGILLCCSADVGRILRTFKIKKNVEVTYNGKIII